MSVSGTTATTTLASAVQYAHDRDIVLVGSAGTPRAHAGVSRGLRQRPGVAGTTSSDTLYSWSNSGSWVDLAAPGCHQTTVRGATYANFCGTSSAALRGRHGRARALARAGGDQREVEQALETTAVPRRQLRPARADRRRRGAGGREPAAPAPSPEPTPAPEPEPAPTPQEPAPEPEPTRRRARSRGTFTAKVTTRSYAIEAGAGAIRAELDYAKATSMTVRIIAADGTLVAEGTGGSPVIAAGTSLPAATRSSSAVRPRAPTR
jgi:hypothetical protein